MHRSARARLVPTLAAGLLATAPASAGAAVQTVLIDGPSASLTNLSDLRTDVAPDGTAAVAYRKVVGAQEHVFVSVRQSDGTWSAPEQVDDGLPGAAKPSTQPALAVANGGKVVVVFPNGAAGFESLYASIKPSAGVPFSPVQQVQGDTAGWKDPQIDLAPNGNGYVSVQEAKHVRAFRLQGTTFAPVGTGFPNAVGVASGVLNVDEPEAGDQRGAKLAVDGTGATATVVWTESPTGGDYRFLATRLSGILPAEIGPRVESTVATFGGKPTTTSFNDMGTVATAGGITWVGYRLAATYPPNTQIPRAIVRTFDGTAFGAPQAIDGVPAVSDHGAEYPRIALADGGAGLAASYRQLAPFGTESSVLTGGTWSPSTFTSTVPSQASGRAAVALDASGAGLVAFQSTPTPTTAQVQGLVRGGAQDGQLQTLSSPAFGPATFPYTAAAGAGRAVTAFQQGEGATTRVVVAVVDLPPTPSPTPAATPAATPGPGGTPAPGPFDRPATTTALTQVVFRSGRTAATVTRGTTVPKLVRATSPKRTFSFVLAGPAEVKLTLKRLVTGKKRGGRCVSGRAARASQRCTIRQAVSGSATLQGVAGTNHVQFDGKLTRARTLALGTYELRVVATAPSLEPSPASTLRLTVKAAPRKR